MAVVACSNTKIVMHLYNYNTVITSQGKLVRLTQKDDDVWIVMPGDKQVYDYINGDREFITVCAKGCNGAAITATGELVTWGMLNKLGLLGHGHSITDTYISSPSSVHCMHGKTVQSVALGESHMVVAANYRVYTCGRSRAGRLGTGSIVSARELSDNPLRLEASELAPVDLDMAYNVFHVAAGFDSSGCVTTAGIIFTWGANTKGECGLGDREQRSSPTRVSMPVPAASLSMDLHTFAVTRDGCLFSWGANVSGALGLGHCIDTTEPQMLTRFYGARAASCGRDFTLVLDDRGRIFTCGSNLFGELGMGAVFALTNTNVSVLTHVFGVPTCMSIATGMSGVTVVTTTGIMYSWGSAGKLTHLVYTPAAYDPLLPGSRLPEHPVNDLSTRIGYGRAVSRPEPLWPYRHIFSHHIALPLGEQLVEQFWTAVVMGMHARLGHVSPLFLLEDEVVKIIVEACRPITPLCNFSYLNFTPEELGEIEAIFTTQNNI